MKIFVANLMLPAPEPFSGPLRRRDWTSAKLAQRVL